MQDKSAYIDAEFIRDSDGEMFKIESHDEQGAYISASEGDTHRLSWAQIVENFQPVEADDDGQYITDYIVSVEDLFRVPAHEVNSQEEAEEYVSERIGQGDWLATDTQVVDTLEEVVE